MIRETEVVPAPGSPPAATSGRRPRAPPWAPPAAPCAPSRTHRLARAPRAPPPAAASSTRPATRGRGRVATRGKIRVACTGRGWTTPSECHDGLHAVTRAAPARLLGGGGGATGIPPGRKRESPGNKHTYAGIQRKSINIQEKHRKFKKLIENSRNTKEI